MITPPIVHLNGTGIETLRSEYDDVADKLKDFTDAWERMEFNARDYYCHPTGPAYWEQARAERMEINKKIGEIAQYLLDHREHLHNI